MTRVIKKKRTRLQVRAKVKAKLTPELTAFEKERAGHLIGVEAPRFAPITLAIERIEPVPDGLPKPRSWLQRIGDFFRGKP